MSRLLYRCGLLSAGWPLVHTVCQTSCVRAESGCTSVASSAARSSQGLRLLGLSPLPPPAALLLHQNGKHQSVKRKSLIQKMPLCKLLNFTFACQTWFFRLCVGYRREDGVFHIPICLKHSSMLPQEFLVMKDLTKPHGCFLYFTLV